MAKVREIFDSIKNNPKVKPNYQTFAALLESHGRLPPSESNSQNISRIIEQFEKMVCHIMPYVVFLWCNKNKVRYFCVNGMEYIISTRILTWISSSKE